MDGWMDLLCQCLLLRVNTSRAQASCVHIECNTDRTFKDLYISYLAHESYWWIQSIHSGKEESRGLVFCLDHLWLFCYVVFFTVASFWWVCVVPQYLFLSCVALFSQHLGLMMEESNCWVKSSLAHRKDSWFRYVAYSVETKSVGENDGSCSLFHSLPYVLVQ